jgi:hypothetical protein
MAINPPVVGGDPTVKSYTLGHPVRLAPSVTGVKTGTPLVCGAEGYVTGTQGVLFAASAAIGGEEVVAYRSCVLELHDRAVVPGFLYTITEIDAYGGLTLDPPPPVRAAVAPAPPTEPAAEGTTATPRTGRSGASAVPTTVSPGSALALDATHLLLEGV